MMEFFSGAGYLWRGFGLLRAPGLRRYVVAPLLVNTVMFAGLLVLGGHMFGQLLASLLAVVPGWLQWLEWILWPLFVVAAGVIVFFTFSLLVNLVGAPFNGLLADAVERYLTGATRAPESAMGALIASVIPAISGELLKLGYFAVRGLPLLLLFLIPVVNTAAPLIWFVFGSWMLAFEYLDYPLGNHDLHFPQQRRLLNQRRGLTQGFGAATMLASMIPIVNCIVMPAAVAGATALYVEKIHPGEATGTS